MKRILVILALCASAFAQMPMGGVTVSSAGGSPVTLVTGQNPTCTLSGGTTCNSTFTSAITAGHSLIAACLWTQASGGSATMSSAAITGGATLTVQTSTKGAISNASPAPSTNVGWVQLAEADAVTGGGTAAVVTFSASVLSASCQWFEVTAGHLDQMTSGTFQSLATPAAGQHVTTPSVTTVANSFVVAITGTNDNFGIEWFSYNASSSGWTQGFKSGQSPFDTLVQYEAKASAGAINPDLTTLYAQPYTGATGMLSVKP